MTTKVTKAYKLYKDFAGKEFESSSETTKQFNSFSTKLKNAIKEQAEMAINWELEVWSKGHFYCSGFIKNKDDGRYYYVSISDVRHSKNEWFEKLLVRTAEGPKDFKGGMNQYCRLDKLNEMLK